MERSYKLKQLRFYFKNDVDDDMLNDLHRSQKISALSIRGRNGLGEFVRQLPDLEELSLHTYYDYLELVESTEICLICLICEICRGRNLKQAIYNFIFIKKTVSSRNQSAMNRLLYNIIDSNKLKRKCNSVKI